MEEPIYPNNVLTEFYLGVEPARISGFEIMEAIARGEDVNIQWAVVDGEINIKSILHLLKRDLNGRYVVSSNIRICYSLIRADIEFCVVPFFSQEYSFFQPVIENNNRVEMRRITRLAEKGKGNLSAEIESIVFEGSLKMVDNTFCGYVAFVGVKFLKNVDFGMCIFKNDNRNKLAVYRAYGKSDYLYSFQLQTKYYWTEIGLVNFDFTACTFEQLASFDGTKFIGDVTFRHANFKHKAIFGGAIFKRVADFRFVCFWEAMFVDVCFENISRFDFCEFLIFNFCGVKSDGSFSLRHVRFLSQILFRNATLKYLADFRGSKIGKLEALDLNPEKIINTSSNPTLRRIIDDEIWIFSWKESGWLQKNILFPLWKISSDCGRSIGLWSFWSLCVVTFFGLLYSGFSCPTFLKKTMIGSLLCSIGPVLHMGNNTVDNWFSGFYFSIVTFSTLGYGDIIPANGAAQFWIVLEVIIGYVMLGGLISIFANKFARRS